jgi:hypothetical protein
MNTFEDYLNRLGIFFADAEYLEIMARNLRDKMNSGYLREDGDGHHYLVPEQKLDRFEELVHGEDWKTFLDEFGEYAIENPFQYKMVIFDEQ